MSSTYGFTVLLSLFVLTAISIKTCNSQGGYPPWVSVCGSNNGYGFKCVNVRTSDDNSISDIGTSDVNVEGLAKVLHKGNDLSSSSDSCPTSRGFVDGPEDFDKMIKPPSPRQVHPVSEKGDLKFGQLHNFHHLLQQNNGNSTPAHTYILQQPPSGKKKCSTLPASEEGDKGSQDGCHFIRVNSGRIELVSKDSWKTSSADQTGVNYNTAAERLLLNRHLKNDVRHSWCGSAIRPQQKNPDVPQQHVHQSKRLSEDQQYNTTTGVVGTGGGFRGGLGSNNNNRIYPQEDIPSEPGQHHHHHHHAPVEQSEPSSSVVVDGGITALATAIATSSSSEGNNGKGLLSPLRERLAAIEELTTSLQSNHITEKSEYEKCVSDLANQVSRAVALQQLMKSEVEKLQQRVVDLENHNKAMATMIIPTLMKLHDTVGIKEGPQLKSIEPAPETSDKDGEWSHVKSEEHQLSPFTEDNDSASRMCISSPSHFIAVCTTTSTSSPSQNASCELKTICYEESSPSSPAAVIAATTTLPKDVKEVSRRTISDLQSRNVSSSSCEATPVILRSPVKAPRSRVDCRIPRVGTGSNSSLHRSNSGNTRYPSPQVISLIESEPRSRNKSEENQSQIMEKAAETSLDSSTSGPMSTNTEMSNNVVSCRNSNVSSNNNSTTSSRTSLSGIPRMSSPARTATVSKIPCGHNGTTNNYQSPTPKPRRAQSCSSGGNHANDNSSPSSTPSGSKLPVRKAPLTNSSASRHPAATSKSLPANSNMGTAFQDMSKSGPQGSKHSKSTFGFGFRKHPATTNSSSMRASRTGTSLRGNSPSCTTTPATNLPESRTLPAAPHPHLPLKPIKLGVATSAAATAIGIQKSGNGKDEGYSTMSSEALAEQEHSLEKPSQRVTNGKVGSAVVAAATTKTMESNKIGVGGGRESKNNSIHKSNTFNTFREMVGKEDVGPLEKKYGRPTIQCDNSYPGTGSNSSSGNTSNYTKVANDSVPKGVSNNNESPKRQFTSSLPNASKGSRTKVSSHHRSPSKGKERVTTQRMMDGNIVRIVRGSPYAIRFGDESGDDMEDEEDPSSSTILWEDSDDSDILFLPLEVSASSCQSSHSTLVPPPQSSGESRRSYYSSWGASTTSGTEVSTLERERQASSATSGCGVTSNDDTGSSNTYSKRAYPLRRTKGEVTVDILLVNGSSCSGAGGGDDNNLMLISTKSRENNISSNICEEEDGAAGRGGGEGVQVGSSSMGAHSHQLQANNLSSSDPPSNGHANTNSDELEERIFIEKWMQLEEVRNEQVQGEEWCWDWDGVERTYTRVLRGNGMMMRGGSNQVRLEEEDDEDDLDVDLILGEAIGVEERNALNETANMQIDSSTWTKSKSKRNKEAAEKKKRDETGNKSNSQEASPEKVRDGDAILIVLEGERAMESEEGNGLLIRTRDDEDDDDADGRKSHNVTVINPDENGIVVTQSCGGDGGEADGEDDPPPVIEFTPEFYRLANYGSNLSFSDNDSCSALTSPNSSATQSPKVMKCLTGGTNKSGSGVNSNSSPLRGSPKKRRAARRSHSNANNSSTPSSGGVINNSTIQTRTDDKISQTDFSCSSLENMSSVSSELSAECRNCLEIIKKLVDQGGDNDDTEADCDCVSHSDENGASGAVVDRKRGKVDAASFATTWISVPKGLPTAEVDRILEILSSSESEGVLSPSK